MFRVNLKYLFVFSLSGMMLWSCGTSGELSQAPVDEPEAVELTYRQSVEFEHIFFEALKQRSVGNMEEAQRLFQQCKRIDPSNGTVRFELAKIAYQNGDMNNALSSVNAAIKREPGIKWMYELKAEILRELGQYAQEADMYAELLKANPENLEWMYYEGIARVNAGEFEQAIELFNAIEAQVGIQEDLSLQKEELYIKLDAFDSAVEEIERLIESRPTEPRYYGMLAELYGANDKFEEAIVQFEKLLRIDPENPQAKVALSDLYRKSGNQDKAFAFLADAFWSKRFQVESKIQILGSYYQLMRNGDQFKEEADSLLEILVEVHGSNARVYAVQGDFLLQAGKTNEAISAFEKSIEKGETEFAVFSQIFGLYLDQRNYDGLLNITDEALILHPAQAEIYYYRGIALMQKKRFEEAVQIFDSGLLYVGGNTSLKSQFLTFLGDAHHELGNHEKSDSNYEKALKLSPNNAFLLNNYAYYLSLRNQDLEKAEKMSGKSNALMPENASFQDTYAWIMYKLNRYDEALEWVEKSILNTPNPSSEVLEHKGDILFKLDRVDEAVEFWKKAQEKPDANEELKKKIQDRTLYE